MRGEQFIKEIIMKTTSIIFAALLFATVFAKAQTDSPEELNLDTPVMQQSGVSKIVIKEIRLDWTHNIIWIKVGEAGESGRTMPLVEYTGQEARNMMKALNTADLSVRSLNQRIIEKLQADGYLGSGSISNR